MLPWYVVVGEAFIRRGLMLFFPHFSGFLSFCVFAVGVFVRVCVGKKWKTPLKSVTIFRLELIKNRFQCSSLQNKLNG